MGHFREAIRLEPKDVMAHQNLGIALYGKGQLEGAIQEYRTVVVMRHFSVLRGAPRACADFCDPTAVSRFKSLSITDTRVEHEMRPCLAAASELFCGIARKKGRHRRREC